MAAPKSIRRLFSHPNEAMQDGDKEKLLYIACTPASDPAPVASSERPDAIATVDVNPNSSTFGRVIHWLAMPHVGDEISRLGWNTCMSCYGEDATASHDMLVVTCLRSSRIYVIDVSSPKAPKIKKVIEDEVIRERSGLTSPTTSHCLGFGQVMVSALDQDDQQKGGFVVLDGASLDVKERWDSGHDSNVFCHDFWYQLITHNVIVSTTGWGRRDIYDGTTSLRDAVALASNSHNLHVWDFKKRTVIQSVDLGQEGAAPLAVRFLHDAERSEGFVSAACGNSIFRFFKTEDNQWKASKVISIAPTKSDDEETNSLPALTSDMVLSLDDKFLFFCNWLQGDVRQYDISDPENPTLVSQVKLGGISTGSDVTEVKGHKIHGGPSNLTLSLDGRRLYVTTSLFSHWDAEIYPDMVKNGSVLLMLDVDDGNGGMSLNQDFLVDFSRGNGGSPGHMLGKEMRYPGGDCSSDIFLSVCSFVAKVTKETDK